VLTLDDVSFLAHRLDRVENAYPDTGAHQGKGAVSCGTVAFEHIRSGNKAYEEGDYPGAYKDLPAVFVFEYPPAFAEVYFYLFSP
jgi:hypothetical protein